MRIVYSRVSTATQSLLRQRHILTEAGLLIRTEGVAEGFRPAEGILLFEDPATTSKIPTLERPAFARVAAAAHPRDVLTVSELFRLCRDLVDIHAVRDWCQARGVALRVLSGPLSLSTLAESITEPQVGAVDNSCRKSMSVNGT
ncbi:recombinase family protein [Nonomuraea sp. NPDC050383]|uniref:recombinase family protein n=1 Tax=Nonomuraea sp. NPDC050383 TaxID=3364362 RepID=UPI0037A8F227